MARMPIPLNVGILIRVIADVVILNGSSFVASLIGQLLAASGALRPLPGGWLTSFVVLAGTVSYARAAVVLTPVAVVVYYLSGFYTFGRAYQSRYKAVIVAEAVTLTYALFGLLSYLRLAPNVPRAVWLSAWLLTLSLTEAVRLCSAVWKEVARWEERLLRQKDDGRIRRVLVIGGAGYVGSALVRQLLRRGYAVRVLDMLLYGNGAAADLRSRGHFEFVRGDFRNIETVVTSMQDVDAVVHLGAIVGDSAGDLEPEITQEVNVVATRLIAEVARGFGVRRLIFTSTCSVYGASDELLDERSVTQPLSRYAKSKLASEQILLAMASAQFSPVILRLGTLYGLSYRPRFDLVVNLLVAKAIREHEFTIVDGEQWRPFLHVDDAARAIVRCLEVPAPVVAGQVFGVGSTEENYQLTQIAAMICDAVPETKVTFVEADGPRRNYRVSCEKIKRRLGFRPARTVRDGIREIRQVIVSGAIADYAASEYSNFKFLASREKALARAIEPVYAGLIAVSGER